VGAGCRLKNRQKEPVTIGLYHLVSEIFACDRQMDIQHRPL